MGYTILQNELLRRCKSRRLTRSRRRSTRSKKMQSLMNPTEVSTASTHGIQWQATDTALNVTINFTSHSIMLKSLLLMACLEQSKPSTMCSHPIENRDSSITTLCCIVSACTPCTIPTYYLERNKRIDIIN